MKTIGEKILEHLNDHSEINIKELEDSLGIATGSIRRSGKLPSKRLLELAALLSRRYGFTSTDGLTDGLTKDRLTDGLTDGFSTDKPSTDKPLTDGLIWVKGRHGYGEKYFVPNSSNPTLVESRFGNYIPLSVIDGIPRYRDELGLWRRVEKEIASNGEIKHDEVGEYIEWKSRRVYIKFNIS